MTDSRDQRVGLVLVSHSERIAEGLAELARQMAPTVALVPAGGTDDSGIGTSYTKVQRALVAADSGAGVVVLTDLGSAVLIAETARDAESEDRRARIFIVDAPLVEGAVAAAVAAETGASLDLVVAAARSAAPRTRHTRTDGAKDTGSTSEVRFVRSVVLLNADGLHARPAAEFVKLASRFPVKVTINGKDAKSLLGIMSLGLLRGATAEIASTGTDGEFAVNALADLIESGFGERDR